MLRRALLRSSPLTAFVHCRKISSVQHDALSTYLSQPTTPESHRAAFQHYTSLTSDLRSTRLESHSHSVKNDPDLSALFSSSIADLETLCADALFHLKSTVLHPPLEECSRVIVEVSAQRAGADGADFAAYLKRMWEGLAVHCGWKCVLQEADYCRITIPKPITGGGEGYRHLVLSVSGEGVWDRLRFERGLHRLTVLSWKGKLESTDVRVMVRLSTHLSEVFASPRTQLRLCAGLSSPSPRSRRALQSHRHPHRDTQILRPRRTTRKQD